MNDHLQKLMEKVAKGLATPAESQELQTVLQQDAEIQRRFDEVKALRAGFVEEELDLAKGFLQSIEQKAAAKVSLGQKIRESFEAIETQIDQSLEELAKWFLPFPAYEKQALQFAQRASNAANLPLQTPPHEMDCVDHQLYFELDSRLDTDEEIEIVIENNRSQEVAAFEFEADTQVFKINLVDQALSPGRYYWKFMVEDVILMGSFFIQKELMAPPA